MKTILFSTALLIVNPLAAYADNGTGAWGWCRWMWRSGGGGFMMILPLLLVIILLYFFMKGRSGKESETPRADTPLEILKKRYAQGEITKEQFEEMKKTFK